MKDKSSKHEYSELHKIYSKLAVTLDPILTNPMVFEKLCRKVENQKDD